jgi:hypothetical protein
MNLVWALGLVCAVNMPFGYWRAGLARLSPAWFVAIHAPVPLVFVIREWFSLEWRLASLPLFLAAYFLGQWLGARIRRGRAAGRGAPRA